MYENDDAMRLDLSGWSFHRELQLIQADVRLALHGELLIDEPLCVDVGMPALVNSLFENTVPAAADSGPDGWKRVPFFVCGCGDPECRVYAFRVERPSPGRVRLTEVAAAAGGTFREYGGYDVPEPVYRREIERAAGQFLAFVEGLDYRPLFAPTVPVVRALLEDGRAPAST